MRESTWLARACPKKAKTRLLLTKYLFEPIFDPSFAISAATVEATDCIIRRPLGAPASVREIQDLLDCAQSYPID
jgi:hypothetical protein